MKKYWKNNDPKLSKFQNKISSTDQRNVTNPKQNKHKRKHTKAHQNIIAKKPLKRENLKIEKRVIYLVEQNDFSSEIIENRR